VHVIMLIAKFLQSLIAVLFSLLGLNICLELLISSWPQLTFFPRSESFRAVYNSWKS
jgi:hypothetical protein